MRKIQRADAELCQTFLPTDSADEPCFLTYNSKSDTDWAVTPFRNPKMGMNDNLVSFVYSVLPVLYSMVVAIPLGLQMLLDGSLIPSIDSIKYFLQDEYGFVILGAVVILLSIIGTFYACHRRMLNRSETLGWCWWAVILGAATPIAVLAIYTRPACLRCTRCEKQRRIHLLKCEHCGCQWERPEPTGIEIFDEKFSNSRAPQFSEELVR